MSGIATVDSTSRSGKLIGALLAMLMALVPGMAFAQAAEAWRSVETRLARNEWRAAVQEANRAGGMLPDYVAWRRYRLEDSSGPVIEFDRITAFLNAYPDWPDRGRVQVQAERAMPADLAPATVNAWFADRKPLTGTGVRRLIDALASSAPAEASDRLRTFWAELPMTTAEERDLLAAHGERLTRDDQIARMDRMIWLGDWAAAGRAITRVPRDWQRVGEARIALARQAENASALVGRVPAALRDDPGLVYERVRWRRREDLTDTAIELLASSNAATDAAPKDWWDERHILVRRLLADRDYAGAYRLAAGHGLREGLPRAEAEWTAGWIALRFLSKPADALRHFEAMTDHVSAPISAARASYWAGRAAFAQGDQAAAQTWWAKAAAFPTTFYGQHAISALGGRTTLNALPDDPEIDAATQAAFDQKSVVVAARGLAAARSEYLDRFLTAAGAAAADRTEAVLAVRLALAEQRPYIAVRIAKQAAQRGLGAVRGGYPIVTGAIPKRPDPALIHAVIRQESEFNAVVASPVGARGLMQLMPATAREVARKLGRSHSDARLSDPEHNLALGSAYLQEVVDRFDGEAALAAAAYNAGPGRVNSWVRDFGDPRQGEIDLIDWIELIPFEETRNYVQRVLEAEMVYRERLAETPVRVN